MGVVVTRQGESPARRGTSSAESESEIQRAIRLAAGRAVPGCVLWRNSTGVATHAPGTSGERTIRYGLVKGGADLVGILTIKQASSLREVGIFLAVEVKTATGRLSEEQRMFGALVERSGGVFIVARSVVDFISQATAARAFLETGARA